MHGVQLPPQPDEERLERERRVEVELLERPPRLAYALGRTDRAVAEIARGVLAQVVEPIGVHRSRLRARAHDDEVAVPGLQGLQAGEQLLALGASLRATDALVGVARREIELVDGGLLPFLGVEAAGRGGFEQDGALPE